MTYVRRLLSGARARAKARGLPFNLTPADIIIPLSCPVLGIPIIVGQGQMSDNSPSLDRVMPQLGYVSGNVLVVSMRANRIKSDATLAELEQVAAFYRNHLEKDWMKP